MLKDQLPTTTSYPLLLTINYQCGMDLRLANSRSCSINSVRLGAISEWCEWKGGTDQCGSTKRISPGSTLHPTCEVSLRRRCIHELHCWRRRTFRLVAARTRHLKLSGRRGFKATNLRRS